MSAVEPVLRLPAIAAVGVVALGACVACHPAVIHPVGPESVEVSGDFGSVPTVTFPTPMVVEEASITTLVDGEGPDLVDGAPLLVDWIAFDGRTGEVIADTFATLPGVFVFTEDSLGSVLYHAVDGSGVNDRVLSLEPTTSDGVESAQVTVVDVRPARAQGEPVTPVVGLPFVALDADGAPLVALPGTEAPADLVQQVLIKGDGEQVAEGDTLLVQYSAVGWADGAVQASTWGEGQLPQTVELASAIPGLQQGLLEQTVGSQVLLVVPPELAYGGDTLVFVVDILDVVHDPDATPTPVPSGS